MSEYQVLARKYRPKKLNELIGQDVLVKTLTSAIDNNRIPHAFILTGIRGVGKTSTARIIARSLLCTGENNNSEKPNIDPCGKCPNCEAINSDNHVDVIEVDAASRTGVNDIREIIDQVPYSPVMGRYKIYIIDEVHMLSKSAFNALLKTLEEPPSHVKFIFATTEIRKIPVTILSRCMRFDLPRVSTEILLAHFENVAKQENAQFDKESLRMIANASEGSVRDGLSLLDQAIAVSAGEKISAEEVHNMLGFADKEKIYQLLDHIIEGHIEAALSQLNDIYSVGVEPLVILRDLQEAIHNCTMYFVSPALFERKMLSETEEKNIKEVNSKVNLAILTRLWQIINRGIEETKTCFSHLAACEMVVTKGCYSAAMPTPDEILAKFKGENPEPANITQSKNNNANNVTQLNEGSNTSTEKKTLKSDNQDNTQLNTSETSNQTSEAPEDNKVGNTEPVSSPKSMADIANLFLNNDEKLISSWLEESKIANFSLDNKLIDIIRDEQKSNFIKISDIQSKLRSYTDENWQINLIDDNAGNEIKSINEEKQEELEKQKQEAVNSEKIQSILNNFEGSKVISVDVIKESKS